MMPPVPARPVVIAEAVRVAGVRDALSWRTVPGEGIALWDGGEAAEVLALVAALPDGEPARCFLPRYGIRLHADDEVVREIAFCFACNRALVVDPGGRGRPIAFDGESAPARELLRRFRAADPHVT
ncbi:hypothetical protein GCM10010420_54230 [Streptomyces glaucosporus]|uniref:GNAT family N-acetyltransferase n=1 Tax=Streptomyces glaucosporus TaxID=284044 RepID=A0ABP5W163_9ACTN